MISFFIFIFLSQFLVCMLVNCDGSPALMQACTVYLPSCSFFLTMIREDEARFPLGKGGKNKASILVLC
ncbi:hypothetical protein GQ55_7G303100 [Panicum hallii var. hallii]|uniref:Secreted protein n=1 Tax=Panicum hallii var. hallii TaxID=1504633 RepID=A0A2T7D0M8_9POAL|nr:hypothetical protein GQ55_7G303100 [Panicum hallii var. hallii]